MAEATEDDALAEAILGRMPLLSGVRFVIAVNVSRTHRRQKDGRRGPNLRLLLADCRCAKHGNIRPQIVVQESQKLGTLEVMEAKLLERVVTRCQEHADCHAAALQEGYDQVEGQQADDADIGAACSADDSDPAGACSVPGQGWGEDGPAAKRQRRDTCDACSICSNHKRLETVEIERRDMAIDQECTADWDVENQNERRQRNRALHDGRYGLIGAVQYWASASLAKAATLLVLLMSYFGVVDFVLSAILKDSNTDLVKQIHTRAYIVERARKGLEMLKPCRSERLREEYYIGLGLLSPEHAGFGDTTGMGRRVAAELQVQQNRPPWQRSMAQRAKADREWEQRMVPLVIGDYAISHGRPCTIFELDVEKQTCTLDFTAGGIVGSRKFKALGKEKGGARLAKPPITLYASSAARKVRSDSKGEAARKDVEALFDAEGARSPSMRDEVRRRRGVGIYETAQALILYSTYAALYALFIVQYPMHKIGFALFKTLRPWYVRRAKREVCQCKHCENFRLYMEVLKALPALFDPVINPPTGDVEAPDETDGARVEAEPVRAPADEWASSVRLKRLMDFCSLPSKTDMVKACLCPGALERGKEACIRGDCGACGFKMIWSTKLKCDVVNCNGDILESAPVEFQSTLKWEKVSSTKKATGPGQVKLARKA
jgi:hypothetical protein